VRDECVHVAWPRCRARKRARCNRSQSGARISIGPSAISPAGPARTAHRSCRVAITQRSASGATSTRVSTRRSSTRACHGSTVRRTAAGLGPWAEARSRFTMLMERLIINLIQQCRTVTGACRIARIIWDEAWGVMSRGVVRGRARKAAQPMPYIGVDEKAFRKGHRCHTIVCDLKRSTVEFVAEDRKTESLAAYYQQLTDEQRTELKVSRWTCGSPTLAPRGTACLTANSGSSSTRNVPRHILDRRRVREFHGARSAEPGHRSGDRSDRSGRLGFLAHDAAPRAGRCNRRP